MSRHGAPRCAVAAVDEERSRGILSDGRHRLHRPLGTALVVCRVCHSVLARSFPRLTRCCLMIRIILSTMSSALPSLLCSLATDLFAR